MGVFGPGIFDNDAALDFVHLMVEEVGKELVAPSEFEDISLLMGAVEVYRVLVKHCCAEPPDRERLESLRDATLKVFDDEKSAFTTDSNLDFIKQRRQTISKTFRSFLQLCSDDD